MKVEDVMSREVKVCTPTDTLECAAQLMWENDCGSLPVVERDSRVVGMVTDRDICMAAYTQGATLHAMQVASAMSHKVFACRPGYDLLTAQQEMRYHGVHRLPVVSADGKLLGIISLSDIARAAQRDHVKARIADTLATVCAPRSQKPAEAESRRTQASVFRRSSGCTTARSQLPTPTSTFSRRRSLTLQRS